MNVVWAKRAAAVGITAGGFLLVTPALPVWAATGGYGPTAPSSPSAPGLGTVVCAETIGVGGGTVNAMINNAMVTITVPANTFTAPIQIICSTGVNSPSGLNGATPQVLFAISVDQNGTKLTSSFANPISATVSASAITANASVFRWTGTTYVMDPSWTVSAGSAMGSFSSDPAFAVAAPAAAAATPPAAAAPPAAATPPLGTVPGATTAVTGKPFVGEGAAAAALIGLGGLGAWRTRRALRSARR